MNAKEELQKILLYETQIECKLEDLARLKALATKMTAAMDGEAVSSSKNPDPMGDAVVKLLMKKDEITRLQNAYENARNYFSKIIDSLPDHRYIKVLYGVYFEGKTLGKIASEMNYSYRNICYIHGGALRAVEKIMNSDESLHNISLNCAP